MTNKKIAKSRQCIPNAGKRLIQALAYIAQNSCVGQKELAAHLEVSESTAKRVIYMAKEDFKCVIKNQQFAKGSEYTIEEWGVFNSAFFTGKG